MGIPETVSVMVELQNNGHEPAIVARDLRKMFKKRTGVLKNKSTEVIALKGVSFAVGEGETYGLLGPNGSGKSTLIRILSTLLTPDHGDVYIKGYHLPEDERQIRRIIGRVSVDAAFFKKLSVRENLLYAAQLYGIRPGEAEKRARAVMERLRLESDKFNEPMEEMSRGQQQKVSVTRALMINPPVLLLDEPTTGLDPQSRRDVQKYIEDLRRDHGTTVLLTTHDMAEAERLCDRIGFLAHGSLVAEGTVDELKQQAEADTLEEAFINCTGEKFDGDKNGNNA